VQFILGQSLSPSSAVRIRWPVLPTPSQHWIIKIIIPSGFPQPGRGNARALGDPPAISKPFPHMDTNLVVHIRVSLPSRFSELAVFDARLYIRVRRIDKTA
jgi:hypothetical protein